jgi:hypothetical protein
VQLDCIRQICKIIVARASCPHPVYKLNTQQLIKDYDAVRQATYKRLHEHYTSLNERLEGKKHPVGTRRTVADPYL